MSKPMTQKMIEVLENLADGLAGDCHLQTPEQRRRGGYFMTYWALHGRGLIDDDGAITQLGREVIHRSAPTI